MSHEEDIKTLRRVYDDWGRGEFWDVAAYDPKIEFVLGSDLPEPGTYYGYEGMERGFRSWLDSWRDLRFEAEEFIAAGDGRILVLFRQTAIGQTSGVKAESHGGHVWTMRDGKAVRLEVHAHRDAALEAAGLA
ncbi:MAG: nuclear transport factor 2 family protein [Solirubrobacterales bacterium]